MSPKSTESASFRYVAFFDLLTDAAFQHRLASESTDSFAMSRHARASIIASALSIECAANCLLDSVDAPKALLGEIDKLGPLSKLETAIRLKGINTFDRGRSEVQKATELIRARNDFVHPRTVRWKAEIRDLEDAGGAWTFPFVVHGEQWHALGIPKQTMLWSKEASLAILRVVCDFLQYVFVVVMRLDDDALHLLLPSRLEFGNAVMPAVFEEFKQEIASLSKDGIDFSFLRVAALRSEDGD